MSYREGKQKIIDYVTRDGMIIELHSNRSNVKQNYQELEILSSSKRIAIRYPGYKTTKTKSDYCVYLVDENGEKPISHVEIMYDLYEKTTSNNYKNMKKYVEDVAIYGKEIEKPIFFNSSGNNGFSFEELTTLMFYIAIQEDINYSEPRYQGRKMCFYRYLEAIYCKVYSNHTINEAIEKACARGFIPRNWDDVGDLYEVVSGIRR